MKESIKILRFKKTEILEAKDFIISILGRNDEVVKLDKLSEEIEMQISYLKTQEKQYLIFKKKKERHKFVFDYWNKNKKKKGITEIAKDLNASYQFVNRITRQKK